MTIYVVQARGADAAGLERARFVADRFSWPAFLLAQLWLLYRRLWLALLVWVVAEVAYLVLVFPHVPVVATVAVDLLARLYLGLEASRLRVAKENRKAVLTEIVEGASRSAAETAFFRQHAGRIDAPDEAAA